MRLIEYDKVYEYAFEGVHCGDLENEEFDAIINAIDAVPTVDAVEAVRCKDCGDWQEYGDDHICEHFSSVDLPGLCENIRFVTRPDDYCSFGFRIKQSETETEEIK